MTSRFDYLYLQKGTQEVFSQSWSIITEMVRTNDDDKESRAALPSVEITPEKQAQTAKPAQAATQEADKAKPSNIALPVTAQRQTGARADQMAAQAGGHKKGAAGSGKRQPTPTKGLQGGGKKAKPTKPEDPEAQAYAIRDEFHMTMGQCASFLSQIESDASWQWATVAMQSRIRLSYTFDVDVKSLKFKRFKIIK